MDVILSKVMSDPLRIELMRSNDELNRALAKLAEAMRLLQECQIHLPEAWNHYDEYGDKSGRASVGKLIDRINSVLDVSK